MQLLGYDIQPEIADLFRKISDLAEQSEMAVYVVGGFVRDLILGDPSPDIDFVLEGDAIAFAKSFKKQFGGTRVVTYNRFNTAMLNYKYFKLEFVTAREEYYHEHSRKPVVKKADIKSDLSRRDFTINAMAIALHSGEFGALFDPYKGTEDLKAGIIRTPLDPEITFYDDPLRIIRAIRFASRFGFEIEDHTWNSIYKNKARLDIVSRERITEELNKMMLHTTPSKAIRLLNSASLLDMILPELIPLQEVEIVNGITHKDIFQHSLKVLDQLSVKSQDLTLRYAALLHDIGKPRVKQFDGSGWIFHNHAEAGADMIPEIGKRLKFSNQMIRELQLLIRHHQWINNLIKSTDQLTDSAIRRFLVTTGNLAEKLILLSESDVTTGFPEKKAVIEQNVLHFKRRIKDLEEKDNWRLFKLAINGNDIMDIFNLHQSKIIGNIKLYLREKVLNGEIENTHEGLINYCRVNKKRIMEEIDV